MDGLDRPSDAEGRAEGPGKLRLPSCPASRPQERRLASLGPVDLALCRTSAFHTPGAVDPVIAIVVTTAVILPLCGHVDCSPPGSAVCGESLGKNTGAVCHVLL